MTKRILICISCLFAFFVSFSQVFKDTVTKKKEKEKDKRIIVTTEFLAVNLQANHDFFLTVNKIIHGKVLKGDKKTVKLTPGVHRLLFEEADSTGEFIEQMFRVTKEMAKQKDSVFSVTFKDDFIDIMNSFSGNSAETNPTPVLNEQQKKELAVINTIEKNMVPIQGGSYKTSSSEAKDAATLTISVNSLSFGKYEITQQQWKTIMGQTRSRHENCNECPVESVSWTDVDSFVRKINRISGKQFRLPTEAEWEYVTQKVVGEKMKDFISDPDKYNRQWASVLENTAWHTGNSKRSTQPVGKKKDLFELHDLFGNVAEWCADYYQPSKTDDPQGPATGTRKVIKGGSYQDDEEKFGAGKRDSEDPNSSRRTVGFRLVMDAN